MNHRPRIHVFTVAAGTVDGRDRIKRAQRSALCERLLHCALAQFTASSPEEWETGRGPAGNPVVVRRPTGTPPTAISLAHSGAYIVAAVGDAAALGVDLEIMKPRAFQDIAQWLEWPLAFEQVLAPNEHDVFYHIWTLWEATTKLCTDCRKRDPRRIFRNLVRLVEPGRPGQVTTAELVAHSLRLRPNMWCTVVAAQCVEPEVRFVELRALESLATPGMVSV